MRLIKRASVFGTTALAAVTWIAAPASAHTPATATGTWGPAQRVSAPSTGYFGSMSCAPSGYCAVAGWYNDSSYVLTEANGRWSKIRAFGLPLYNDFLPGPPALVSCPSAGNCVVLGEQGYGDVFAVSERKGVWGKPQSIPGLGYVTSGGSAQIFSFACTSAGNCVAGGKYISQGPDGPVIDYQPFVISEENGVWSSEDLPGTSVSSDVDGNVTSISCTGHTCLADGYYAVSVAPDASVSYPFVAMAKNGVWGNAELVPGLPSDGSAGPVSCSPDGTCTVEASLSSGQKETLSEKNGTWNTTPNVIPGSIALNGSITSLSCASPGNCGATGQVNPSPYLPFHPFVLTEHDGTWGQAQPVPGLLALSHGKNFQASIAGVSCGAPGNCAATGWANVYVNGALVRTEAFVVNQVAGRWRWARVVPGIVKLNKLGNSRGTAVACWSADHCAAGGLFALQGSTNPYPFVTTES